MLGLKLNHVSERASGSIIYLHLVMYIYMSLRKRPRAKTSRNKFNSTHHDYFDNSFNSLLNRLQSKPDGYRLLQLLTILHLSFRWTRVTAVVEGSGRAHRCKKVTGLLTGMEQILSKYDSK